MNLTPGKFDISSLKANSSQAVAEKFDISSLKAKSSQAVAKKFDIRSLKAKSSQAVAKIKLSIFIGIGDISQIWESNVIL